MGEAFKISCKNCGTPVGYDIINQSYRCPSCGTLTGVSEVNQEVINWRVMQKNNHKKVVSTRKTSYCPSCGAKVLFEPGEESETCDFCGGRLLHKEFLNSDSFPELVIPFAVTKEQARERLLDWARKHKRKVEGKSVLTNIDKLEGYYLPYQLVRGPVYGTVSRDTTERKYNLGGYLDGVAVNTSIQLDNEVLDAMEPYDWSTLRPYEHGYVAGHRVKLSDLSEADTEKRVISEAKTCYTDEVERVMQTMGINLALNSGTLLNIPALLPAYVIQVGKFTAAVNGQTGKISVSSSRYRNLELGIIEPAVLTVLVTLILGKVLDFDLYGMGMLAIVLGLVLFTGYGSGDFSISKSIIYRDEGEKRSTSKAGAAFKNPFSNMPIFYERGTNGFIPVKLKFYPFSRVFSLLLRTIIMVFAPAIFAIIFRAISVFRNGGEFWNSLTFSNGAAWYVIVFFACLIFWIRGVRQGVYERPYIYEIQRNGELRLIGDRKLRKISILDTLNLRLLLGLGGIGYACIGLIVFIFIGSAFSILP